MSIRDTATMVIAFCDPHELDKSCSMLHDKSSLGNGYPAGPINPWTKTETIGAFRGDDQGM